MPQTPKLSPQQKAALVEKIKAGEISRQAAAQSVGVSNTTVRQWLRIYESEGADGLAPREKSRHLTAEEKQAAVAEYLAGGVSLFDVCKKYGIRSPQNLQKLVEKAQAGGELRGYHGASRHRGGAYTTAADREKIVRECLADGCDYGAAALKYDVDYKALVHWVGQYRAGAALHDARHSSEGTSRAKGRARTVPPMQRMVMVLDCLENRKNYGAMAQKYAIAYHQIYRWVQRYLQDGWLGMNDRRGPADDPDPAGEWGKIAPAGEVDAEQWVAKCKGVPEALPAMLRRAGYSWMMIAKILFDLARMSSPQAFPDGGRWPAGPDEGRACRGSPCMGHIGKSALISQRSGPLTASVSALRAASGGCASTRACGRSPAGEAARRKKTAKTILTCTCFCGKLIVVKKAATGSRPSAHLEGLQKPRVIP